MIEEKQIEIIWIETSKIGVIMHCPFVVPIGHALPSGDEKFAYIAPHYVNGSHDGNRWWTFGPAIDGSQQKEWHGPMPTENAAKQRAESFIFENLQVSQ